MYRFNKMCKCLCSCLLISFPFIMQAQLNAGAYFSTFNLPGVSLRTNGFGLTGQYEAGKKSVYELSVGYFSKRMPLDSVGYTTPDGSYVYVPYRDVYHFYHISADFFQYLAGDTRRKTKFSFYIGAGASMMLRQTKSTSLTSPVQAVSSSFTTFGFEYLMGFEYKLGFARIFIRGRANLFLKYPVPLDDGMVIPLLVNTQGGLLFPLIKHQQHGRVVM